MNTSDPRAGEEKQKAESRRRTNAGLLRLKCPHCNAEYPLWFLPDGSDDTLTGTEWEKWLDTKCGECGATPRSAMDV